MGARHLAGSILAIAIALALVPTDGFGAKGRSPLERATAVRDSVRSMCLRYAYTSAESLATAALRSDLSKSAPDSLLASIAEWRLDAIRRGGTYARPEARDAADEAIRLKERAYGKEHAEVARALALASTIYNMAGNTERADSLARRSVEIYGRTEGEESLPYARALQLLSTVKLEEAAYAEARSLNERSIAIRERLQGPGHADVAAGLNALGVLLRRMGEYEDAREAHERALQIRERALPPDHPDLAWSLNNYANTLYDLGEIAATKPLHERALDIRMRSLGPDHPDVAFTYNNLANTLHALGDYSGARAMLESSLAIRQKRMGPDHIDVAQSLNNLAYLLHDAGEYQEARALYERSLAIRERARGPRHPDVTTTLDRLSAVLADIGDLEGARRGFERSLSINRAAFGEDHIEVAEPMVGLAGVVAAQGDSAQSELLYRRSLAISVRVKGTRHVDTNYTRRRLAELVTERGRPAEACSILGEVLEYLGETGLGATPEAASSWASLGVALARSGRAGEALDASLRSEAIGREHLRLTARSVEEVFALRYAATRPGGLDLAISLLEQEPGATGRVSRVWDAAILGRAAILDELASRRRSVAGAADSLTRALADSLAHVRERLARLALAGPGRIPVERYAELVEATSRTKLAIERALAERSARFRAEEANRVAGFAEVSAALPLGAALVAYVRFDRTAFAAGQRDGEGRYGAFVLRGNPGRVRYFPLGASGAIDSAIGVWRDEVSRAPSPARRAAAEARCRTLGARLRALVLDPLQAELDRTSLVLMVPDGSLQRVPFGALPAEDSSYLVEQSAPFHVVPAERDLVSPGLSASRGGGMLALGGPDFDAARGQPQGGDESGGTATERGAGGAAPADDCREAAVALRFAPLPGARDEAREVARRWEQTTRGSAAASTVVLVGREATEDAVKRKAPGRRVVHLATHGFFLRPLCPPRAASAASGSDQSMPDLRSLGDPLLRAGLALAGSNGSRRPDTAPEDGLLTGEEIAGIDLDGVEWVVLSACDTGAGEEHVSEGLLGLRRALQTAGAQTAVVSLWRVDDAWALRWMRALYDARFVRGLDTAHAARRAALEVVKAARAQTGSAHPYTWGAFVASGAWR
jgi:CHAT domain-containing protein/tetratricopeptide (TPR) repeat protein